MKRQSAITLSVDDKITDSRLQQIQRVRYEIYSEELQLSVAGLDHERKLLIDVMDRPAIHITAYSRETLAGAVRLNVNAVPMASPGH